MSRAIRALLLSGALLALPGVAEAAVTGSSLAGISEPVGCSGHAPCILAQDELDEDPYANAFTQPGTVTSFTFRHVTGRVNFVVLRETDDGDYVLVNSTTAVTGSGADEEQTYTLRPGIHVREDDFIGLALAGNATAGARDAADEFTNLLELTVAPLPDLVSDTISSELFLQARWDPSATELGPTYGTVTAMPDPLAALRAGARPHVRISARAVRASRRYSLPIKVTNPNAFRVTGRLSLRLRGRKLGARSFSLRPGVTRSVRVRLSRKARVLLRRRRKLTVTASAFVRGPIGTAGRTTQRITIKAPR
jgi:hypothetical protein